MRTLVAVSLAALFAVPCPAPAAAADTAKINEAVKKAADFLKTFHAGGANPGGHGAGSIALTGLAVMAAGADAKDATVSSLANYLRPQVFTNNKTYDVSLMILFFDKLGLAEDEGLIQLLGVKLVSGQNGLGGWGYDTWPSATPLDGAKWVAAFRSWKSDGRLHPEVQRLYQTVRLAGRAGTGDDNSNTQFAVIATWVAGRHAVPVREAVGMFDNRFLRTQDPQSWGWAYSGLGRSSPSMTCAGLLGLAVAFASKSSVQLEANANPKPKKEEDDDPFTKPPAAGAGGEAKPDADKEKPNADDLFAGRRKAAIDRALANLGRTLTQNAGGGGEGNASFGGSNDLYFYWSLERVGVAYGLEKIGGVDWYEWGAPSLLKSQAADGSWSSSHGTDVGTAFGILFLTRANFAIDLSAKLKGNFGSELRGGGIPIMKAIPFAEQEVPKAEPGKPPPKISGIREITQADGMADALVNANKETFAKLLKEYQSSKGEQYTAALAFALTRLEKDNKKLARAALVDRLVRMTPETLKKYTSMNEPELRRAAILACAAKDDKTHLIDLIARVNDPDDEVVKAARVGLRSLAGEDFGPPPGASEEEKQSVSIKWRHWLAQKGTK